MFYWLSRHWVWGLLLALLLLHLPFLEADPDGRLAKLVGPFSDEGLYTIQLRNWLDHNYWVQNDFSPVVLSPLFNLLLLPFFYFFGTHLIVARLVVLLFTLLTFGVFARLPARSYTQAGHKQWRSFVLILGLLTFTQFHVFHFSHFCMAEILAIDFIFLGLYSLIRWHEKRTGWGWLFLAVLFVSLSYYVKIMFIYTIFLVPAYFLLKTVKMSLRGRSPKQSLYSLKRLLRSVRNDRFKMITQIKNITLRVTTRRVGLHRFRPFVFTTIISCVFLGIYLLGWYVPHWAYFDFIWTSLVVERLPTISLEKVWELIVLIRNNYELLFLVEEWQVYWWTFGIALPLGLWLLLKRKTLDNALLPTVIVFSLIWILAEMPKIGLSYIPPRYFISLYFAISLFIAATLASLFSRQVIWKIAVVVVVAGMLLSNMRWYVRSYQERTFDLKKVNASLAKIDWGERPFMGPFAASLSWQSKALALPIWHRYVNYDQVWERFGPRAIVEFKGEEDLEHAFFLQGFDLAKCADSIWHFRINNFELALYWISERYNKPRNSPPWNWGPAWFARYDSQALTYWQADNNFEGPPTDRWDYVPIDYQEAPSGNQVVSIDKQVAFGPIYTDTVKRMNLQEGDKVLISCQVLIKNPDVYAKLVVSLHTPDGEPYFGEGQEINKYIHHIGKWQKVHWHCRLPAINSGADRIKVYIWSHARKPVWIDDMVISIEH